MKNSQNDSLDDTAKKVEVIFQDLGKVAPDVKDGESQAMANFRLDANRIDTCIKMLRLSKKNLKAKVRKTKTCNHPRGSGTKWDMVVYGSGWN